MKLQFKRKKRWGTPGLVALVVIFVGEREAQRKQQKKGKKEKNEKRGKKKNREKKMRRK